MSVRVIYLFLLLLGLVANQATWAYSESDVDQLLETKSCEGCDLSGATLKNLDFRAANLTAADLSGSDFSGSNLRGANLTNTYLYDSKLIETQLEEARFFGARLSGVDLTGANLRNADFDFTTNLKTMFALKKTGILLREEGEYPEITSFDLNGIFKYMTSKSGLLYKSQVRKSIQYGRYVQSYPDLFAAYKNSKEASIEEWGKRHWETAGQHENRILETLPKFDVVLDLNNDPNFVSEQEVGLLSVVTKGNLIYLSYTIQEGGESRENVYLVVDEFNDAIERLRTIVKINTASFSHVAGSLVIDRNDNLYLSVGEGRISDYEAQDVNSLLGKILRIDLSRDNPVPRVIAYGLRNPWKISIDSMNRMFIGDCGEDDVESVYLLEDLNPKVPYNLGWPVFEGTERRADNVLQFNDTLQPIYEYRHHSGGRGCVIGGIFINDLKVYLFGDYFGRLRLLKERKDGKFRWFTKKDRGWREIHYTKVPMVLSLGQEVASKRIYMSGWDKVYSIVLRKDLIDHYPWMILCRTTMPNGYVDNTGCEY